MRAGSVVGSPTFVGRDRECQIIDRMLETTSIGGSATLIVGEAGIGKTTLLNRVAERAAGFHIMRTHGVQSDAMLSFAAAADLLLPLREHFSRLPTVQRHALEVGLALRPGSVSNPLAACAASLNVLGSASEAVPLLVLVDDLQWVDPQSQQILRFVARRLSTERIALLCTLRIQDRNAILPAGIPVIRLAGLSLDECRELAEHRGVAVSAEVLERLVDQTGGNPLAIVDTLSSAPTERLVGAGADFTGPEIGPTLQRAWSDVLDTLPAPTAAALFAVAVAQTISSAELEAVLARLGINVGALGVAERSGLLRSSGPQVELPHPLLRHVIIDRTPSTERLQVYRALAETSKGHLRAWYAAAAATAPDDDVADALDQSAADVHGRGDFRNSARTWSRAAEFTADAARRAGRLRRAAEAALVGGQAKTAVSLADSAVTWNSDLAFAADIELIRARSHIAMGYPRKAIGDLVRMAEAVEPVDRDRAAGLYAEATWPCAMSGQLHKMLDIVDRCLTLGPQSLQATATAALALVIGGRHREGRVLLAAAVDLMDGEPSHGEAQYRTFVGQAFLYLEDYPQARVVLRKAAEVARRAPSPAALTMALVMGAELGWWSGGWAEGYADGSEALRWAEELGQAGPIGMALTVLARLDAARGDSSACRLRMERASREVGPYDLRCMEVYLPAVLGLDALCTGRLEDAIQHLDRGWRIGRELGLGCPTAVPLAGDLIEARLRVADRAGAEEVIGWAEEQAAVTGLAYPAAVAARGRGLLAAELEPARHAFAMALAAHDRCSTPYERARTLLCQGESLRRLRRPAAARRPLQDALAIFDRLGARPWAARTVGELEAAGVPSTRPQRTSADLDALTPQEMQSARMVAKGLNNVEAAACLFISRKTVEAHLSRIYRKLGLRSRAELARMFGELADGAELNSPVFGGTEPAIAGTRRRQNGASAHRSTAQ